MKTAILAAALVLAASAAQAQQERTVAINADASLYERAQALRAVNELTGLGYPTRIVEANDNPDATLFFLKDTFGKFKQNQLGITVLGSIAMVFVDRIQARNFDLCGVVAHELLAHAVWNIGHQPRGFAAAEIGPDARCRK